MAITMNSMQRVLTTLCHQEPDRVPLFLLLSLHGARLLKMSIKDYLSTADAVFEAQMTMKEQYNNDVIFSFFYGPIEIEAFGGEVIFTPEGPPNSGKPFITKPSDIINLNVPNIEESPVLSRVIDMISKSKKEVNDSVPIIGVVMSPFSLPVMQMGFANYLELIYNDEKTFRILMEKNQQFCINWANAQIQAGATAICYFDPVSSPTIIPPELYTETGYRIAKETIARINGPTATHMASGISIPIADQLSDTGTAIIGVSSQEDLRDLKNVYRDKLTVIGNLNGIEMRHWTEQETRDIVKDAIKKGAPGGGFILSDNHGEIPWQVKERTLQVIAETVEEVGEYPIQLL